MQLLLVKNYKKELERLVMMGFITGRILVEHDFLEIYIYISIERDIFGMARGAACNCILQRKFLPADLL